MYKNTSPKTNLYLYSTSIQQNITLNNVIRRFNNEVKPFLKNNNIKK